MRQDEEVVTPDDLPHPHLPKLRLTMQFIDLLRGATHENSGYPDELYEQIFNPLHEAFDFEQPDVRLCMEIFIHTQNASRKSYQLICAAVARHNPDFEPVSWDKMNHSLASWTGIHLMRFDMCPKGCVGYTGDYSALTKCPDCGESRHDEVALELGKHVARQQFFIMPPGPQFQARWLHPSRARDMKYGFKTMQENIQLRDENRGHLPKSNDVFSGAAILDHFERGRVNQHDVMGLYACDGAQLYQSQNSDCWFGSLVILNLPPDMRYKQEHVCPVLIIPGPNKPKNMDSFHYPLFHQFAALMKQGFAITDGDAPTLLEQEQHSHLHFMLAGADGPGMTELDGGVGHSGAAGCRAHCPFKGRHKCGVPHYYPALQRPFPYNVPSCSHPDGDPDDIAAHQPSMESYLSDLSELLRAQTDSAFEKIRLKTGLTKPTLLLGLPLEYMIGIPHVFCLDFMHIPALNSPDLLLPLFRGSFSRDSKDTNIWAWAESLSNKENWEAHGALIGSLQRWIPAWYGRSPRNPAKKVNTDFKAWEFMVYLYGLGPMVFREHLPLEYWKHYCKLVRIVEIANQTEITAEELVELNGYATTWQLEYEELYIERKSERLHFVRPWIHLLLHLANEIFLKGPPAYYAQWTMERVIGYLKDGLRLHSNPYANLAWVATRLCQVNAMKAMVPDLVTKKRSVYDTGRDIGDGFALLHPREDARRSLPPAHKEKLVSFMDEYGLEGDQEWQRNHCVRKFARVAVPNGSVIRSAWKENLRDPDHVLVARHAEVSLWLKIVDEQELTIS
jgi:hypothetical protein